MSPPYSSGLIPHSRRELHSDTWYKRILHEPSVSVNTYLQCSILHLPLDIELLLLFTHVISPFQALWRMSPVVASSLVPLPLSHTSLTVPTQPSTRLLGEASSLTPLTAGSIEFDPDELPPLVEYRDLPKRLCV